MIDNDELDAWLFEVESTAQKVKLLFIEYLSLNIG